MTGIVDPDTDGAVDFLEHWAPGGPWVLSAIEPDGPIETRTFRDRQATKEWIEAWQGRRNIHFSVNTPKLDLKKKAAKADIGALNAFHVDLDSLDGADPEQAKAAIFLPRLKSYRLPPSVILDSGGGLQGFWLMREPVALNGPASIEQLEARQVPQTEALKIQKTLSLNSLEKWWLAALSRGFLWKSRHGAKYFRNWHPFYTTELLNRSYLQWCQESRPFDRKSREELGRFMTTIYSPRRPRQGSHPVYELDSIDGEVIKTGKPLDQASIVCQDRPHGYWVGELEEARGRFTEICDVLTEWGLDP